MAWPCAEQGGEGCLDPVAPVSIGNVQKEETLEDDTTGCAVGRKEENECFVLSLECGILDLYLWHINIVK